MAEEKTNSTDLNCTYDPLVLFMAHYADAKSSKKESSSYDGMSVEERLKQRIIDGDKIGLDTDLKDALSTHPALDIINTILLGGMKVVGELFGSGEMQLPFVLQSAETMKAAVKYLEPFMEKVEGEQSKGVMILATVKGDVHDIGKNLVDIILTNNGYRVVNLGIKMALEPMLEAYKREKADAIGMSGLLVKSTAIMKENLEVMQGRGLQIPVVLGGAALTRKFVEKDLRELYGGALWYAQDAFDGLHFMEKLKSGKLFDPGDDSSNVYQPTTLQEMITEMKVARRELLAIIEPLEDSDLSIPETFNTWSLRDVLVHIIEWERISIERLRILKGGGLPKGITNDDVEEMNARFVAENQMQKKSDIIGALASTRSEVVLLLETITPEEFKLRSDVMISLQEWLPNNSYLHERQHIEKIAAWLRQREEELDNATGEEGKMVLSKRDVPWLTGGDLKSILSRPRIEAKGILRLNDVPTPPFWGVDVQEQFILDSIWKYLNEIALFRGQWQLKRGKKTITEHSKQVEEVARPKLRELMLLCKQQHILKPQAVYGYFPCWSDGDDLVILKPLNMTSEMLHDKWSVPISLDVLHEYKRFSFPRQSSGKHLCISSFFLNKDEAMYLGKPDVVAMSAVTVGKKASEYTAKLFAENKYVEYLYLHGLSVETAEALAEYLHKIIRAELGIGGEDAKDIARLFSQGYRGSRYSFGYPACPDLEDQAKLFDLLHPERINIFLTEEYHLEPEQSTTAIICHHPEARYFGIK